MTTKRKSLLASLEAPPEAIETIPAPLAAPAPRKPMADRQHTSVYIPMPAYERLREIAFAERVKIHDLLMEGLDKVIAERGHSERAKRDAKAR